ncbi:MAG TPA: hypothetical protein VLG38_04035, partial [Gammaproteobacteria bacterium]|nr:hypothetical protein [Gammaproteobacteria bacterium]
KRNTEYLRQLMNELTRAIYVVAQSLAPFEAEMDKLSTNIGQVNNRLKHPELYAGVQPKVARAELI